MQNSHSYIVIGLFPTEISPSGAPLALLWKGYNSHAAIQLEVLFAEDLDQHTAQLDPEEQQWVKELIHSIQNVTSRDPERVEELFERLSNLSVGPVRTTFHGYSNFHGRANDTETLAAALQRLEAN
jgi:hypothetical protein